MSLDSSDWRSKLRWFAAEFLVVVSGILVALALNAWWASRQERQVVATYLGSLQTELQTNLSMLEGHLEALEQQKVDIENYVLNIVLAEPGTVSQDSIQQMMWAFGPPLASPARRAAFDDLVSGGLRRIDNTEVRHLILEYGQAMELDASRQERAEIWFDERMEAYNETHADLVGMRTAEGSDWSDGSTPMLEFDPNSFVGNRQFANILMARYFRIENIIESRSRLRDTLTELLRATNDR
jgi:hypothetical protein